MKDEELFKAVYRVVYPEDYKELLNNIYDDYNKEYSIYQIDSSIERFLFKHATSLEDKLEYQELTISKFRSKIRDEFTWLYSSMDTAELKAGFNKLTVRKVNNV